MSTPLLAPVRPAFRALAETIVPEAATLDEERWREVEAIIERALDARPPAMRRQLVLFIRVLQLIPLVRFGTPFTRLDPARRARVLAGVQRSPLLLVRRGFWGLRTLVFMGYYARPEQGAALGYRADPRGWEARR